MQKKILLTSFEIWLSQQESKANDLLLALAKMASLSHDFNFLHRLSVDV
ncbi:MAG: hypothetical protein ACK6A9_19510 [Dolichospermum sp.]|jgi:pyroglutamyl-peptidase|nr:hypothetical protein [Anabaena sp. 49628_E55]